MASAVEVCEEKARLLREKERATDQDYQAALRELERRRATSSTPDYEQLAKAVYDAKVFAERVRRMRQRHIADHGC